MWQRDGGEMKTEQKSLSAFVLDHYLLESVKTPQERVLFPRASVSVMKAAGVNDMR